MVILLSRTAPRVFQAIAVAWCLTAVTLSAGTIRCQVIDDIHGSGVAGSRLVLSGAKVDPPRVGTTDSAGIFSFQGLPKGDYSVTVEKAGYYLHVPGSERWAGPVSVMGDSGDTRVTITLVKFRSVSGSVLPQGATSADTMDVYAVGLHRGPPEFRHEDRASAQTDEAGNFRLSPLSPGRYAVCATVRGVSISPAANLPVCYPDPAHSTVSSPVDLRFTEEVSHIVLATTPTGGVSIEGTVASLPGVPDGAELSLYLVAPGPPATPISAIAAQVGKRFRFTGVPPGGYTLVAFPKDARLKEMRGIEQVHVSTEDIAGTGIRLAAPEVIAGQAALEKMPLTAFDRSQAPNAILPVAGVVVYAESEVLSLTGSPERMTNTSGEFKLEGAVQGLSYLVSVRSPKGTYISSVSQGERTLDGAPFPISAGAGNIRITLRDDGGNIDGLALRPGAPMHGAFIVLAPEDRRKQHLFRTATSAADGSFRLTDIAPGNYDLVGLNQNDDDMFYEPDYLSRFLERATKVTVSPARNSHLEVEVIDTGSRRAAR